MLTRSKLRVKSWHFLKVNKRLLVFHLDPSSRFKVVCVIWDAWWFFEWKNLGTDCLAIYLVFEGWGVLFETGDGVCPDYPHLLLFWPLSIVLRPLYLRKWMCIAEKHLCGRVKMWTALHTSGTSTHGLTHRNRSMLPRFRVPHHRVKSCISTKLRQATSIEYISYNLMRSGSEPSSSGSFPAKSFL